MNEFFKALNEVFESAQDDFVRSIKANTNYPPYNLIKVGPGKYVIEMSVAGFGKEELSIDVLNDSIVVKGSHSDKNNTPLGNYLFNGLASRNFARAFRIRDMEIQSAELVNGILRLNLDAIAEASKKLIPISDGKSNPQVLTENK